ncbi:MAG: SpoIIE family protein phosphatase [Betaproteobacteria bacterium]|nr:SpoIIE family protein phosphatase [Betaproteobacteria bacterium]
MATSPAGNYTANQITVLVVDDTTANRQVLQMFLKKLGFIVALAEDGAQAVEQFSIVQPDMILMDVMMPVMDGYEATRRIKAMCGERWVPVVFLSALDKDDNLVAGLDAGGDDYLAKPVSFVVLDAKLRSLMRTMNMQRALAETRRRAQAISDNIIDGVITLDQDGKVQTANPSALDIFGYAGEELIGCNAAMLLAEADRNAGNGMFGAGQREVLGVRKNGAVFPMELGVTELHLDDDTTLVAIVRDISERKTAELQLRENAERLQRYHDAQVEENALAQEIMFRLMRREGLNESNLSHWLSPAANFSGDIVAAKRSVQGRQYALLADASGHGLGAAISALPVLMIFIRMAERNLKLSTMVSEFNKHLRNTLPMGRFVALAAVCIDDATGKVEVWNGGMPDVLLLGPDGRVMQRFISSQVSLGILDFSDPAMIATESAQCPPGCQMVLYSDGLLDAENQAGVPFGLERMTDALASTTPAKRLDAIKQALAEHVGAVQPYDDISVMLIERNTAG